MSMSVEDVFDIKIPDETPETLRTVELLDVTEPVLPAIVPSAIASLAGRRAQNSCAVCLGHGASSRD